MPEETPQRPKKIEMYHAGLRQRVEVLEDSMEDYRKRGFKTAKEIRDEAPAPASVSASVSAPAPAHESEEE